MLKAAIFDMDGILIDSEPLWQEAEITAFARVGLRLTRAKCAETMGLRVDEVVRRRYDEFGWEEKSLAAVQADILSELEKLIDEKGQAMPGVEHALGFFERRNLPLALASSSHMRLIERVLQKLELTGRFRVIHSAEYEQHGKPHPAIYLSTLAQLGLPAHEVVAFEDSFNGLLAAKTAGLKTVCIPEPSARQETRFDIAACKLNSLAEFSEKHFQALAS